MSDFAILIEWPKRIEDSILDDIINYTEMILDVEKDKVCNYASGYNSILIQYNFEIEPKQKIDQLQFIYQSLGNFKIRKAKMWEVPVCYDDEFGPDLQLYIQKGISAEKVVGLHTSKPYRVFMIGFLPGFLYLGGLQNELHLPRKSNPRQVVAKGSVAIGGEQTGIYPKDSPGGWQIIGRTPMTLFDIHRDVPISIRQGDYIQFKSIDRSEFDILST